jgi:hypothetical protein
LREYKLYCVDTDGRIVRRYDYAAEDDFGALDRAKELCGEYEIEIWEGARFAARVARDGTASLLGPSAQRT